MSIASIVNHSARLRTSVLVLVLVFTTLSSVVQAQVQMLWEKWIGTTGASAIDITSDGRYLAILERMSIGGDVLLIRDNLDHSLQGYSFGTSGDWRTMRIFGDSLVRFAGLNSTIEFDLRTRIWIPGSANDLSATTTCKEKGGIVNVAGDMSHVLFTNHLCTPVRVRLLRYSDNVVVKDWFVPEPFYRVSYGRSPDEFVYHNDKEVGIAPDKRMTFPDVLHIEEATSINGQVYVLYKSDDTVHHLCRIDPDNLVVLSQVDIVTRDNSLHMLPGPTSDLIQIWGGGRTYALYNALSLQLEVTIASHTAQRILKVGDDYYVAESGKGINRTKDLSVKGEVFHYISKPIIGIAQDSRSRVIRFDDTLTFINPRTGAEEYRGTTIPTGGGGSWSSLIADPFSDQMALGAQTSVKILEGELFTKQALCLSLSGDDYYADTLWRYENALTFATGLKPAKLWISYRLVRSEFGPNGYAELSTVPQPKGNCTYINLLSRDRYAYSMRPSSERHALEFETPSGPTAALVADTTYSNRNLQRVGTDRFILTTADGYNIVDGTSAVITTVVTGSKLIPLAVCERSGVMCCWRAADSTMVLNVISSGVELWSVRVPSSPRNVIIDREGMWMIFNHPNGHLIAYDIHGVTSVEQPLHRLHLSPNPASDYTNADIPDQSTWSVVDALGREWIGGSSSRIPLVGLPSGMYYVRTTTGGDVRTAALCVQR